MCSYSGVVTCLWRHGNIFICEVSVSGTKVTASCKNRKTFMTKIGTLNFLLLLVNIYQKLSTLQVIFQWIIIIILKSSDKNMLFQHRNLRLEFINQTGKVQMHWYFSWFLLDFCLFKNWKSGRISIFHIQFSQHRTSAAIFFHTTLIAWIAWVEFHEIMWIYWHILINVDHSFCDINRIFA